MEPLEFIFVTLLFVFILSLIFTKKGRNLFVKAALGEIIKDYGVLGKEKVSTFTGLKMPQHTRLLKVRRASEIFYVLEANFFGAVQYMKLSSDSAQALAEVILAEK